MKSGSFVMVALLVVASLLAAPPVHAQDVFAQGDCTSTSASGSIGSVSHTCPGSLSASGSWSINGGDSAYLIYTVDGTTYQTETKSGTSGSWSFADTFTDGCDHTFAIQIVPKNAGTYCWTHSSSFSQGFHVSCTSPTATITACSWQQPCGPSGTCSGTCWGTVSGGGGGPFSALWTTSSQTTSQTSSSGSFSTSIVCSAFGSIQLEGSDSECGTDTSTWPCGAE